MGVSISIDLDGVSKKLSRGNFKRGQYAMANQMLADMNQFVPKKSNTLRQTGRVSGDGSELIWSTEYAGIQFYGPKGGRKKKLTDKQRKFIFWALKNNPKLLKKGYSTLGTGPRWDLKAKGLYMKKWEQAFLKGAGF
ncbi:hypothetical protein M2454_001904 [Aequitasia blattaphilus]|uniref:Minor capsid protein n=1 Tax=Aequitasia blattaphilus TaxID=2949332 RepID=A0ABT1EDP5_9FIRM|nr:minor capsid protein [Aequitasia blattaphilus]MCP1102592.1 minor capsid protein [Aequitasia blattaphilus]MCR8615232.1 minor capsid protein [Aequitasia blattaphilus]